MNFIPVKYVNDINKAITQTFHRMQRVKLTCFHVSNKYVVFGATSGGIYIFQKEPCHFFKLIPSKEGSATLISISEDENHLGVATSKGLILIVQDFCSNSDIQHKVYGEHESQEITCLKWHGNDLYSGDVNGKIAVVSTTNALKKVMFQLPSASLMLLDSSIVQIDTYFNYLVASTKTRSYLCDVEKEHYKPIGRKLRNGSYGACFVGPKNNSNQYDLGEKTRGTFTTVNDNELLSVNKKSDCVIYCARPGVRLWQVDFEAAVEVTYQLKNSLLRKPSEVLVVSDDPDARFTKVSLGGDRKVPDNFNLQKIFPFREKFIVTCFSNGLYVFDPPSSELNLLIYFKNDIRDFVVTNSCIYVWETTLEISVISMVHLEDLVLSTLRKKRYYLCAEICANYLAEVLDLVENSKKIYLISILKSKIEDRILLTNLDPIFEALKDKNQKDGKLQNPIILDETINSETIGETQNNETNLLDIILKQYTVNKTHSNIEIPDYLSILENLTLDETLNVFNEFRERNPNENATIWCGDQFLKQVARKNINLSAVSNRCLNYLTELVLEANKDLKYSCRCDFPLPKCHNFVPRYYNICKDLLNSIDARELLTKNIPYLLKHSVKTDKYLITQFSDLELFRTRSSEFTYDTWDEVVRLFLKLNKGFCLNCDSGIDVTGILSWTDLGLTTIQSIGPENAVKIFKRYSDAIPNGSLESRFYQACIFVSSLDCKNNTVSPKVPVDFMYGVNETVFQKSLEKYLDKKYMESNALVFQNTDGNDQICSFCQLPLKNPILCGTDYDHSFHSLCFTTSNDMCNLIN